MTPTQLEHLKRIDAHLERLLDIASKRTPGEWEADQAVTWDQSCGINPQIVQRNAYLTPDDATFIASCAGNAEAGWRATRAVIQWFLKWDNSTDYSHLIDPILAAFPIETLETLK